MNMGGYSAPPVMMSGGGAGSKHERGSKNRGGYSQYGFPYGWEHHMATGGFYGPTGFGVHMPMMRGHMGMDPAAMDYMAEQFQGEPRGHLVTCGHVNHLCPPLGLALSGGGYYNHSPPSGNQFPGMGGMDHVSSGSGGGGSYSPPHNLSPKGVATSAGINGYNSVSVCAALQI